MVTLRNAVAFFFKRRNIKTKHPGISEAAYKTTVRPQDIHKVEMVQRRATRWILSSYSPYQSATKLQQQLYQRTLEQRRVDAKVIMMFKIIHGLVAITVPPYFEQQMRSTRHSHPLALRQIHTKANYYKFAFFPSTVVYWNQLPAQILLLPTLDQFSVAVRAHNHHIQ